MKTPDDLEGALGEETVRRSDVNHETPVTPDDDPNFDPPQPPPGGSEAEAQGTPADADAAPPVVDDFDYDAAAEEMIGILDFTATLAIPFGTRLVNFSREEWRMVKDIKKRILRDYQVEDGKVVPYQLTPVESDLMVRYHEYKDAMDEVPLEDDEVQRLKGPMAAVLKKYAVKPGPEALLVTALITIYGPRMAPMAQPLIG